MEKPPEPSPAFLQALTRAVGGERVLTGVPAREAYAWDNTGLRFVPGAVVLAETEEQVAAVLVLCQEAGMPVTPRGAGTGNVGGSLAVQGGVVLSLQRMNRILAISPEDRYAVVEPGVVNADLQQALKPHALFWPPDPSSAKSCTIGGNIAMCSAGPHAVALGVTRDWVLGLKAVLPGGRRIRTGGRTTKNVVGFDLTRLLVGSEGLLAVVTEAVLKLAPLPGETRLVRALFRRVEEAARAVSRLMEMDPPPAAIEFLDAASLELLRRQGGLAIPREGEALLLVEVSGAAEEIEARTQRTAARLLPFSPIEMARSSGQGAEAETVWAARFALSPALKKLAPRRVNEDVVVPVSRLPDLVRFLEETSREAEIPIVTFGHAGNGNLHVNLLADPSDPALAPRIAQLVEGIFRRVLALDGSLSGEHGIGLQKRSFLPLEVDPPTLALHKQIKALFDPRGILNPGKVWP